MLQLLLEDPREVVLRIAEKEKVKGRCTRQSHLTAATRPPHSAFLKGKSVELGKKHVRATSLQTGVRGEGHAREGGRVAEYRVILSLGSHQRVV
jgi:hypothetical protein